MKTKGNLMRAVLFGSAFSFLMGCHKDDAGNGQTSFEITDAPADNANIQSVFVTVADLKVDGQSVSGFNKQTIDIKALQNGNTAVLGSAALSAKTYSSISLVLDLDKDASGNTPGCYVLKTTGEKVKLVNSTTTSGQLTIFATKSWAVTSNTAEHIVIDFDLRKAIRETSDDNFSFSTSAGLVSAVRIVSKENAGTIKGTYSEESLSNDDKVMVFAYKKGTFNALTETQTQGEDEVQFKNAITSAVVGADKSYTLSFLDNGDYELHFAGYKKNADNRHFMIDALLNAQTSVNGSVSDMVSVQSNASVSVDTKILGKL